MFLPPVSVCLSVCLSVRLLKKLRTDSRDGARGQRNNRLYFDGDPGPDYYLNPEIFLTGFLLPRPR